MRLRSRRNIVYFPESPRINRQLRNKATPRRTRSSAADSPTPHRQADRPVDSSSSGESVDEVPTLRRRALPRGHPRKRLIPVDDRERDLTFKTPIRSIIRHERILSEIDPVTPRNNTARNIYSPIVRFLTPSKESDVKPPSHSILLSPEQGVFGYGSMDLLVGDEDDDVFSPFTFIKNIPSQSQHSQSTPEATLVLDLEETLMYSSLTVIEDAEYSFNTVFQDHQYKVYMVLRPFVQEFLQSVSKNYELFVYTCAKREYAEKILGILDPHRKLFRQRLYQEDCSCVLGHYIKDLSVLGRDLAKTVVLDNAPHTYPHHLMNTIPITSWSGQPEDRELQRLVPYMDKLCTAVSTHQGEH
uniref:CTD (carboxy-terminal domain, RNA polymerase II, polypeptide A) small phosphatase like 3 n=1 Tax=Neogobius melanostomus TaxID=47308 RepID=A0A8C6UIA6_9GOBI